MNAGQLERFLRQFDGTPESDLDVRARKLRDAGLLPRDGRGAAAPDLNARDAAALLLGVAATNRAVEAADAVKYFGALAPAGGAQNGFASSPDLLRAIAATLESVKLAGTVERITIFHRPRANLQDFGWAELVALQDGRRLTTIYAPPELASDKHLSLGSLNYRAGTIGGATLHEVAQQLAEYDDDIHGALVSECEEELANLIVDKPQPTAE
jgi:hypothetical protein